MAKLTASERILVNDRIAAIRARGNKEVIQFASWDEAVSWGEEVIVFKPGTAEISTVTPHNLPVGKFNQMFAEHLNK